MTPYSIMYMSFFKFLDIHVAEINLLKSELLVNMPVLKLLLHCQNAFQRD